MIRIAIIGYGKIARDQHVPALTKHGGYELKAVVTTSVFMIFMLVHSVGYHGDIGFTIRPTEMPARLAEMMAGARDQITGFFPPAGFIVIRHRPVPRAQEVCGADEGSIFAFSPIGAALRSAL